MLGLYVEGSSVLHRLPAGIKVLALAAGGTVLFLVGDWRWLAAALAGVVLLYAGAGIPWRDGLAQIRPMLWILALIFAVQVLLESWSAGLLVVLRFAVLILLASLVTLTTPVSAMITALERGLAPLAWLGLNPSKISLAIAMAIRFIPVIADQLRDIRDAQRTRGLDRSIVAVAVPLILRTLKMANDVAEAIEARSYDPAIERPSIREKIKSISIFSRRLL